MLIKPLVATVGTLLLLAVEAFFAMLTYTVLQLYSVDLFGYLVGLSRSIMNIMVGGLQAILPSMSYQIEASLAGELSPKAVLLLLIGLVVGTVIRFLLWAVGRMAHGRRY